jgi:RNA polymerase sigma factor (sigma-70 family)
MAGRHDEFDRFFVEHYTRVCRALWLSVGRQTQDVEDAAQTAFAKAFQKWQSVSRLDRPAAWVYVVAVRQAAKQIRRQDRERGPALAPGAAPTDESAKLEQKLIITGALDGLPPRQRMAVVLRYYADLTNRECARAMRCSEGTVKATVHAALANLRPLLVETKEVGDER